MLYTEHAEQQAYTMLNVHAIKKDGCLANLLVSLLASECEGRKTVTVGTKDIRSFRSFRGFAAVDSLVNTVHADPGDPRYDGFSAVVNKNQNPVGANGLSDKQLLMRLTALGKWVAFSLLWDLSLFAMCITAEINLHNCSTNARNTTICGGACKCHGVQRVSVHERRLSMANPFTMIKFTRRFPDCSRCKISRTLKELERLNIISVTKSMHCNVIRPDLEHPLLSKYSSILSKLTEAMYGVETLENTSQFIRFVHPDWRRPKCPQSL